MPEKDFWDEFGGFCAHVCEGWLDFGLQYC